MDWNRRHKLGNVGASIISRPTTAVLGHKNDRDTEYGHKTFDSTCGFRAVLYHIWFNNYDCKGLALLANNCSLNSHPRPHFMRPF